MADDLTFDFERTFTDVGAPGGFQVGCRRCRAEVQWEEGQVDGRQGRTMPRQLSPPLPAAAAAAACRLR